MRARGFNGTIPKQATVLVCWVLEGKRASLVLQTELCDLDKGVEWVCGDSVSRVGACAFFVSPGWKEVRSRFIRWGERMAG